MEVIQPLLIVSILLQLALVLVFLYGISLEVKDESCPQEVMNVKINKIAIKVMLVLSLLFEGIAFALSLTLS